MSCASPGIQVLMALHSESGQNYMQQREAWEEAADVQAINWDEAILVSRDSVSVTYHLDDGRFARVGMLTEIDAFMASVLSQDKNGALTVPVLGYSQISTESELGQRLGQEQCPVCGKTADSPVAIAEVARYDAHRCTCGGYTLDFTAEGVTGEKSLGIIISEGGADWVADENDDLATIKAEAARVAHRFQVHLDLEGVDHHRGCVTTSTGIKLTSLGVIHTAERGQHVNHDRWEYGVADSLTGRMWNHVTDVVYGLASVSSDSFAEHSDMLGTLTESLDDMGIVAPPPSEKAIPYVRHVLARYQTHGRQPPPWLLEMLPAAEVA